MLGGDAKDGATSMRRHGFERALLPRDWPLSTMLDGEPGWRRVYEDELAVLFCARRPLCDRAKVIRR